MSRHRFCILFFLVTQHKLICRSILPVLLFNLLSRHKISCCDKISAFFLFLVSGQELLLHLNLLSFECHKSLTLTLSTQPTIVIGLADTT